MDFDLLKRLCETPAVSGREDALRDVVKDTLGPLVDEMTVDAMGNVIGLKCGKGERKLMIAAHMDEIGFIVKFVDDQGFLRIQPLGGFDPRQLFAQRVVVHTRSGDALRGVLSYTTKPIHLCTPEEMKEQPKVEKFFVDIGLPVEAVKDKVAIGDMVTMDRTLETCGEGYISKALDDRVGVFVMLEALKAVDSHEVDVYAVATVQEEVGLRGATTAAYGVDPDIGVALDVTLANDFPGQQDSDAITRLGEGVAIKIMDSSLICHPKLVEHMRVIAEREDIPHQMEVLPRGGTDGGALQRARAGSVSMTLSIPTRYIHTVNEMARTSDIQAAADLLAKYISEAHTGDYSL